MTPSHCAICGPAAPSAVLYPSRFGAAGDADPLDPKWFSARRLPDRMHSTIKQCGQCGLVFADPIPDPAELGRLYGHSEFNYAHELPYLARTYRRYVERAAALTPGRERLLEIGCGNGFVLAEALALGFREVVGVEPSEDAVRQAPEAIRAHLTVGSFDASLYDPASMDVICAFQVLDHLPNPRRVLEDVWRLLKPGGVLLLVQHHVSSWSARVLGERSPIFDIAHPYLYEPATLQRLLASCRFNLRDTFTIWNTYTLRYWLHLVPMPASVRQVSTALTRAWSGHLSLTLPVGNFGIVAARPASRGCEAGQDLRDLPDLPAFAPPVSPELRRGKPALPDLPRPANGGVS